LRGTGVARPTMTAQLVSVGVNVVLAPILIAGWGTGRPLGVAGAAIASCIAVATSAVMLARHFIKSDAFVRLHGALWRPDRVVWRKILTLGGPAGGELAFTFIYIAIVYWAIRDFGAAAQAGFGIALRIMQSLYLPAFAVAFASTPVGGQNYGAHRPERVRETFRSAALIVGVLMAALTLLCQIVPAGMLRIFSQDPEVVAIGANFLRIVSWNLVPYGLAWTCSGLFQALGNTVPSFISMASRILTFAIPVAALSFYGGFRIEQVWYLWVVSVVVQCLISFRLLRAKFRAKLVEASFVTP
jgi:MATE family, multidrug efflux pump